jgi:hypothetical protein
MTNTPTIEFRPIQRVFIGVDTDARDAITKKAASLSKRFAKFGASPLTVEFGPVTHHTVRDGAGFEHVVSEFDTVTIFGNVPVVAGGWVPVASLDHTYGKQPIISLFPHAIEAGLELPERFEHASADCQHCELKRQRSVTVIFRNDEGEHLQVGRSCLKDYTGLSPSDLAWMTDSDRAIDGSMDVESRAMRPAVNTIVQIALAIFEKHGFVPAQELNSTKDGVLAVLADQYGYDPFVREIKADLTANLEAFHKGAKEILEWAASDHNTFGPAKVAATADFAGPKTYGLLAALPMMHARYLMQLVEKELAAQAKAEQTFVGEIGQKITVTGTVTRAIDVQTAWGVSVRLVVTTDEGAVVTTFGSGATLYQVDVGDRVDFSGTVKDHTDNQYGKQTHLTRAKVKNLVDA